MRAVTATTTVTTVAATAAKAVRSNNGSGSSSSKLIGSIQTPKVLTLFPTQRERLARLVRHKEPHKMTWSDGLEEVVKLVLAATVGALVQRMSFQAKMQNTDTRIQTVDAKVAQLEKSVAGLEARVADTATRADVAKEVSNLQNIVELKLSGLTNTINSNMQTLTALVQRALDRSAHP